MSNGNIIAFNPCSVCSEKNCLMCELDFRRKGAIKSDEWISVEERLPKQWEYVLVCCGDKIGTDFIASNGRWYEHIHDTVTHWMPLPEAPKGGAE